ncbi:class I SAM-dependent methyltransferase [Methylibium sp.]|jgi:SAM-dependent methyltransferase|uniref:class I SAM-dependent methyltransferase n=1 Tax=Methylibium sp. TaxID=2067992 RepID=UPI003D13FE52
MGSFYDDHILPRAVDVICGLPSFERGRADLVPHASGRVLEIGMGTGRNLPYYRAAGLRCLCGVDPGLHALAQRRAKAAGLEIQALPLSAERIPVDDRSFDCVVSTFTLCTIPDAAQALKEVYRVLVPGGRLLFLEHGAAPDSTVRRWQDRITPYWRPLAGGCHLNREMPGLIESAGFTIDRLDRGYRPGPRWLTYLYSGVATRPHSSGPTDRGSSPD